MSPLEMPSGAIRRHKNLRAASSLCLLDAVGHQNPHFSLRDGRTFVWPELFVVLYVNKDWESARLTSWSRHRVPHRNSRITLGTEPQQCCKLEGPMTLCDSVSMLSTMPCQGNNANAALIGRPVQEALQKNPGHALN